MIRLFEHKNYKRTGIPKVFFLTRPVLEIIERAEALHEVRHDNSPYVFPRRGNQTASNWLAKSWQCIVKRAGIKLDLRQLRSGFINAADDAGFTKDQVAGMTQHMSLATIDRHYRVVDLKRAQSNAIAYAKVIENFRQAT
jgi:hypothetical protein